MSAGAVGHTPGPWVVVNPGQFLDVVSADTRKLIVPVWPDDHGRADAALIAAAPDLLAALEFLMEHIDEPPKRNCSCHISPPCNDCVDYSGLREAFSMARAALAKAGGRSA